MNLDDRKSNATIHANQGDVAFLAGVGEACGQQSKDLGCQFQGLGKLGSGKLVCNSASQSMSKYSSPRRMKDIKPKRLGLSNE